ncbi:hypothetical protein HDU96_009627 [Phlyctochytrium bullatum]|nr:hypothetical protein HDU96_009627 [Phlyctochytrium bullatum]
MNVYRASPRFSKGVLTLSLEFLRPEGRAAPKRIAIAAVIPCPIELINHLINYYFEQFHPVFPMIDKDDFFRLLSETTATGEVDETGQWPFLLLLISLVTVMLQFTPSLRRWGIRQEPGELAMECLQNAKKILYEHIDASDVMAVQAIVLLAMSAAGRTGRGTITWTFSGMAVRKAQELGMHRDFKRAGIYHPTLKESVMETRRRTWFCVLIAETYISVMTGRPLAIHPNDWDTDYPRNDNEDVQNLLRHVELAGIFGSISRFANRARPVDREHFISDIEGRLNRWYSIIESSWLTDVWNKWDSRAFMLLMYHSASILFHRVAYNRIDDCVCMKSAQAVTKMLSAFPAIDLDSDRTCVIFPTVSYGLLMTCTVWIARLMADRKKEYLENVKCCLDAFDNLRGLSSSAGKGWKIVTEYLQMKGIRLPSEDNKQQYDARGEERAAGGGGGEAVVAAQGIATGGKPVSRIPMDSLVNTTTTKQLAASAPLPADLVMGDPLLLNTPAAAANPMLGLNFNMWWDSTNLFDLAGLGALMTDVATTPYAATATTGGGTPSDGTPFTFPDASPPVGVVQNGGFNMALGISGAASLPSPQPPQPQQQHQGFDLGVPGMHHHQHHQHQHQGHQGQQNGFAGQPAPPMPPPPAYVHAGQRPF